MVYILIWVHNPVIYIEDILEHFLFLHQMRVLFFAEDTKKTVY